MTLYGFVTKGGVPGPVTDFPFGGWCWDLSGPPWIHPAALPPFSVLMPSPAPRLSAVGNWKAACSGLVSQHGLSGAHSSPHHRSIIKAGKQAGGEMGNLDEGQQGCQSLTPGTMYVVAHDQQLAPVVNKDSMRAQS